MIKSRKNYYTLTCVEFAMLGGLVVHAEVNVGSVVEARELPQTVKVCGFC